MAEERGADDLASQIQNMNANIVASLNTAITAARDFNRVVDALDNAQQNTIDELTVQVAELERQLVEIIPCPDADSAESLVNPPYYDPDRAVHGR